MLNFRLSPGSTGHLCQRFCKIFLKGVKECVFQTFDFLQIVKFRIMILITNLQWDQKRLVNLVTAAAFHLDSYVFQIFLVQFQPGK